MQTRFFLFHPVRQLGLGAVIVIGGLTGCAWEPEPNVTESASDARAAPAGSVGQPPSTSVPVTSAQQRAATLAGRLVGTPYRWGGASPDGFDCSGLIHYVYASANVALPRTAADQERHVRNIPLRDAQPGDLLFFDLSGKNDHVAIYVGDAMFVHAPSKGKTVQRMSLENPYFRRRLSAVGRVRLEHTTP